MHDLYVDAAMPGTSRISKLIRERDDLPDTVSHEMVGKLLHGEALPRWEKLLCVVQQLCDMAVSRPVAEEERGRFHALWLAAERGRQRRPKAVAAAKPYTLLMLGVRDFSGLPLRPEVGDVAITVRRRKPEEGRYGQISSISLNGRLNFRGGLGRRAWPHTVRRLAKVGDADHDELPTRAREEVAVEDRHPERVTNRELALLDKWKVPRRSSLADYRALHEALDSATEERPMQVVLENHPALLANVITGNHGVWVGPQVRLGDQYVSDFLIASQTSAGLRWHLVELECPPARLTNAGNQRESPTLRHAI
ncbi:hypothetical protein [Streptomyces sp. NPDC020742]|uniref:hypothetical protein n=1 Tax=Streptomyces sp. NPDC020742 TaxID=3154897 RepID=UPI0033E632B8